MALYLSPLVDINEVDLTTTIPSVATSMGVLAIRDPYKGPELKDQLITTLDELIDVFGEPTSGSYKDILAAAGYLKFGNKLYATAAFAPSASYAGMHSQFTSASLCDSYTTSVSGAYVLNDFASALIFPIAESNCSTRSARLRRFKRSASSFACAPPRQPFRYCRARK